MNSKQASGVAFGSGHRGMDSGKVLGSGRQMLSNLGGGVQVILSNMNLRTFCVHVELLEVGAAILTLHT